MRKVHEGLANETPEKRQERLQGVHGRLHNETSEKRQERLQKIHERLDHETSEEKQQRLSRARKYLYSERETETPEKGKDRQNAGKKREALRRKTKRKSPQSIEEAAAEFQSEIKQTPVYVCTSCHRLLRRKTVREMNYSNYNNQPVAQKIVLNKKYRKTHRDGKVYICITCHNALKRNKIPIQSQANGLELSEIPPELQDLNEIEQRLIAQRILFMQLKELPAAVNVPAHLGPACTLLPRIPSSAHIIPLKFKRKLGYKSAYIHDSVRVEKVIAAFQYLKAHNLHYIDKVNISDSWIQHWQDEHQEMYEAYFENSDEPTQSEC